MAADGSVTRVLAPGEAKKRALETVSSHAGELIAVSHDIHARPELSYQEHYAVSRLVGVASSAPVDVEHPAYGIETSFAARAGAEGPLVVICCEYDALPGIGHGCAHNVIAAMSLGAGLALAPLASELNGRLLLLGTPAEENNGGGKIRLLEAGAFEGATVAMMAHPEAGDVERVPYLANDTLDVVFTGKAAHASSSPWKGVNALDALVLGYSAVGALRQHIRAEEKIHGIITEGGQALNVVPARAAGRFKVRARNQSRLNELKDRVLNCFMGAAKQTGATLSANWLGGYAEVRANRALAAAYRRNGEALGRTFVPPEIVPMNVAGSTDMGNVSLVVPSIHPAIGAFPLGTPGHSEALAAVACEPAADRAVLDGASILAMTAIDVWTDAALRAAIAEEFAASS